MNAVTISSKYQVVIPRAVRERLGIRPGTKMQVIVLGDRIELVPVHPMKSMRGFLKGCDPGFAREENDRT